VDVLSILLSDASVEQSDESKPGVVPSRTLHGWFRQNTDSGADRRSQRPGRVTASEACTLLCFFP
jgi:hypothetical protein